MGLLGHLLFWPVTGPTFLTRYSIETVEDVVRGELTDDGPVKEELLELQLDLEEGSIDDEEYLRREAVLMQRLRDVRAWREEFGMATAGGAVRVAGSGARDEASPDRGESRAVEAARSAGEPGAAPADADGRPTGTRRKEGGHEG
jgi:hypothetical protein